MPISKPGLSLIELLLFVGILGMVIAMGFPLLFRATENRLLQQTISIVEQNGTQMLQTMVHRVRHAERILLPLQHGTGSVLALQMGSGAINPTSFGVATGSLILIERVTRHPVSSSQVAVSDFVVRNTSVSNARQSVLISFRISRTIRLQASRTYARNFTAAFTLFPDDVITGDGCGCAVPGCSHPRGYIYQVCDNGSCLNAETHLECR